MNESGEVFSHFYGNDTVAHTLRQMIEHNRISQTILLSGPEGVGKATLARRFAAYLLGEPEKIEADDLSLPGNADVIESREKWPADKRNDDPLFFSTHPDFVTFAPEGPLRTITIQQMRLLRERAQFKPLLGRWRVFLIDRLDKANEQSANSLLKVLEEPPEHMVFFATAENLYDLLPTIRSRSVVFPMSRLTDGEVRSFCEYKKLDEPEARVALSEGSPGMAATLNLEQLRERRGLMLTAFECGAGVVPFSSWVQQSESFSMRKSEKLDVHLKLAYGLLQDALAMMHGRPPLRNRDLQARLTKLSQSITVAWLDRAVKYLDELLQMSRRNIQKTGALDAMIINLRNSTKI